MTPKRRFKIFFHDKTDIAIVDRSTYAVEWPTGIRFFDEYGNPCELFDGVSMVRVVDLKESDAK